MKRFRLNISGKNMRRASIFAGFGVAILLLFLLGVKLYSNETVVTAANKEGSTKGT